jgi:PAS domain S-box-containing protein
MNLKPEETSEIDAALTQRSEFALFGPMAPLLWILGPLLLLLIYLADVRAPTGLVVPFFYIAALILVVALPAIREKILAAATCTILMILDFSLSPSLPGIPIWMSVMNHGLALLMMWIVTGLGIRHRRVAEGKRQSERLGSERLAQINTIYASAPVGLCFVNRELRYVSINEALAELIGHPRDFFTSKSLRETIPGLADGLESHCQRVMESGQPVVDVEVNGPFANHPKERRHWLCSYYPVTTTAGEFLGINIAVRDITRRKQAEADTLFLLDLGECIRFAANPDELLWAVAVALGEHLRVSRCGFVEIDVQQDQVTVLRDYHPHISSLTGSYSLSAFGSAVVAAGTIGQIIVINDVATDQRTAQSINAYLALGISAFVASPLLRDGELVSGLIVAMLGGHNWSEREVTLVNIVAERTWLAVEKLRLDNVLRETDQTLRDADRRKDEFLATLAHELRNPLSLIRNVVALQKAPDSMEYDSRWGHDIIERQVSYLTRLTDDLFDVSRITRDKLTLQKESANLIDIIKAALESSRPLIDLRQHRLTLNMPTEPIYVEGDRVRLTQVFMNLLNNSAKYTSEPGHIQLNVELLDNTVVVRVKDTGIGIATENLPHLFELFYQVDRSYTRAEGGLGLGLTLVHRLVEMHGGVVEVHSEGVNRGSEFMVRLPTVLNRGDETRDWQKELRHTEITPVRGRRVLVADDFPESAATLARLLRQDGNEVQIAQNGLDAFDVAERFRPDVIVLDIAMPKLNGYEVARKIREQSWGEDMVLIALTGWGQKQDRQRTQEAGFDAHLTKPVNYDAIMEILVKLATSKEHKSIPNKIPASAGR